MVLPIVFVQITIVKDACFLFCCNKPKIKKYFTVHFLRFLELLVPVLTLKIILHHSQCDTAFLNKSEQEENRGLPLNKQKQ